MTNIARHKHTHTQTNTQGENIITSLSRVIKILVAFTRTCMCVVDGSMSLIIHTWWRHQMETFSALLARCQGNPPVTGGFLSQRPVTRSFEIIFEPWWGWLFETTSCPLWRRCNVWLLPIHLSASSTLDVATSSLVIKVGQGAPCHKPAIPKTPGDVKFIAVKWSQNVLNLEKFHKRNWYLSQLAEIFWKKMISLHGFEGNLLQQLYCLDWEISRNNAVWLVGCWNK